MATSERDIRKAVALLLNQYGRLETSEVKKLLQTVMPFDEDDKMMSNTRNEPLIIQRIGNIVSHQTEKYKTYLDTYAIDKSDRKAYWYLLTGLNSNNSLDILSDKDLKRRQELRSRFIPKKIDWQSLNESREELGKHGEEFVIRYETNRILQFAPEDTNRIIHLSEEQGDGAGFDIISLNEKGMEVYIEVKTTKGSLDTPFYMTENERAFFELYKDENNLFIYRVYNYDEARKTGDIKIISAETLFTQYQFDPISYKVTKS
ncbi:DUF3883 domain-containing protein [Staphylococcus caledonicus]|uniref:DUF3883 domain-containing protein n=1 Tax=Staphylococcus sp. acrmy TaxID=2929076 RepID=UPI001F565848|nr:DUF3883 domain-containing protein [Staphylococcus sp. acrmy]MCI2948321.1 DUF3883 domain-containing protein [Staphylococcus sp. acrmy]